MDSNQIAEIALGMEVVYKATMELYEGYFTALKAAIDNTPNEEVDKLNELNALALEAEEALEHDLGIFEKALAMDAEELAGVQDELKIQSIYNKLQK